jgi:acetyl-CoA carboxylase biotin carboxyl carrier protein
MEIKDIEQILKILKQSDIRDFELEQDGTKLKLVRGFTGEMLVHQPMGVVAQVGISTPSPGPVVPVPAAGADIPANYVKVVSPIVGTFYRKPSPDAEAFVKEGDKVKKGDTLCIVEAMKLMNEIEAPSSGKVVKVLLSDAEVVEFGEVLVLIDPEG